MIITDKMWRERMPVKHRGKMGACPGDGGSLSHGRKGNIRLQGQPCSIMSNHLLFTFWKNVRTQMLRVSCFAAVFLAFSFFSQLHMLAHQAQMGGSPGDKLAVYPSPKEVHVATTRSKGEKCVERNANPGTLRQLSAASTKTAQEVWFWKQRPQVVKICERILKFPTGAMDLLRFIWQVQVCTSYECVYIKV